MVFPECKRRRTRLLSHGHIVQGRMSYSDIEQLPVGVCMFMVRSLLVFHAVRRLTPNAKTVSFTEPV